MSICNEQKNCILNFDVDSIYGHPQRMVVQINGEMIDSETVSDPGKINIPFVYDPSRNLKISVEMPDAVSPQELKVSKDPRKLAFIFKNISIEAAQ